MQKIAWLLLGVLLLPAISFPVEYRLDGTTVVRFEERATPGFPSQNVVPATQFIGFDMGGLGDGNLSLHLYGWGRVDLADRSTNRGDVTGDLTYGYLAYRLPTVNAQVKLGRMWVYEGAAREQLDGIYGRTDLAGGFTLSVFGGAPVHLDHYDNKGDYIVGGRGAYRAAGVLELGISGLHEQGVVTGPVHDMENYRQLIGGDIWLSPHRTAEVSGHTFYNAATGGIAENSYLLLLRPIRKITIGAEYEDQRAEDFFASANLRSLFNPDSGDKFKAYGASVTFAVSKPLDVTVDYKRYDRDSIGESDRYGVAAKFTLLENRLRSGVSYHRADGAGGINSYHEARGYVLYDAPRYFASLDTIAHIYDDPIYTRDDSYEILGSLGYRILQSIALSGDLSYGQNPWYDEEIRGVVRLTFNLARASKGARP